MGDSSSFPPHFLAAEVPPHKQHHLPHLAFHASNHGCPVYYVPESQSGFGGWRDEGGSQSGSAGWERGGSQPGSAGRGKRAGYQVVRSAGRERERAG